VSVSASEARPGYAFDNENPDAVDRHNILPAMFDDFTTTRLASLGDLTGRRCLELGAGGGSVARWLADRVGPTGHVLATDINVRHLPTDGPYQVLRHDLVTEPVPAGPWDVIHARLLLLHLAQRREILSRLVPTLAPGGALCLEEFETTLRKGVLVAPEPEAERLYEAYQTALLEVLQSRGNDPTWAGRVHGAMLEEGLVDVETVAHARSWPGGSAGALLIAVNIGETRSELIATGLLTGDELDQLCRHVRDPRLVLRGHIVYSIIGRRPRT
jgi:SAM-dependent methyltransferase